MKRIALTVAVIGILAVAADRAFAQGALSYPMAAHVAARYGVQHPGHNPAVIRQVRNNHHSARHYRPPGYHHGPRPGIIYAPVHRYPPVVLPVYPHGCYPMPYRGFSYHGRTLSLGFGF